MLREDKTSKLNETFIVCDYFCDALHGVEQGVIQANHVKPGPLRRMQRGDGLVIYAPKLKAGQTEPYQRFVALGEVER